MTSLCLGCGAEFTTLEGPTHAYMASSPGCWEAYGHVLAREYEHPDLFAQAHALTVGAFALQHPGDPAERRAYRSVRLHYASLHLIFAYGVEPDAVSAPMRVLSKGQLEPAPEPPARFNVDVGDVLAVDVSRHVDAVRSWARDAYEQWDSLLEFGEAAAESLQYVRPAL